jgi:hypothetical protein
MFYLMITSMAIAMVTISLAMTGFSTRSDDRADQAQRVLQDARRLVLEHLVNPDTDGTGRRLGQWGLFPDLPIAAGAGLDASEPNIDGFAEAAGCATSAWVPGQALSAVSASLAAARCFGRLPWKSMGLPIGDAGDDVDSMVPWVIISPNLVTSAACLPNLHPSSLAQPYAGYACLGAVPYPWITVRDARGNVVSDRVAIALVLPGVPVQGQVRGPAASANQYLDSVTINAGCPVPCQPGTYSNAEFGHPDGQPTTLIQAPVDAKAAQRLGYYAQPYNFNDQVVYITVEDLMRALEARARLEVRRQLEAFKLARGYFPFAADLTSTTGTCVTGQRLGRIPVLAGSCAATDILSLPAWLTNSGWHRYFVYSVSPRCVPGNNACNAPGLTVAADTAVNAVVISPGSPISTAPFAPSRAAAQTPMVGFALSGQLADYLDAVENAGGTADVFDSTVGAAGPNNDRLEIFR